MRGLKYTVSGKRAGKTLEEPESVSSWVFALQQVGVSHQSARSHALGQVGKAFGFVVHHNTVDAPTERRAGNSRLIGVFLYMFLSARIIPLDQLAFDGDFVDRLRALRGGLFYRQIFL